jgi:hypothetical protein
MEVYLHTFKKISQRFITFLPLALNAQLLITHLSTKKSFKRFFSFDSKLALTFHSNRKLKLHSFDVSQKILISENRFKLEIENIKVLYFFVTEKKFH